MNFKSLSQLENDILRGLPKIPRDIDLIVGIPRSGMLPASILALYLNVALTDLDGFLNGRLLQQGISRTQTKRISDFSQIKKVLILDDSCCSGRQLAAVKESLAEMADRFQLIYAAVYVTQSSQALVDIHFDVCPMPRAFSWNIMHHPLLTNACLDIDGVLCIDPTNEENDDGSKYRHFLLNAPPLWIPTIEVGWLVTSRLEKYRPETEEWMKKNGVRYKELIMLNMESAVERRAAGCHGSYKGKVYRDLSAELFIESNPGQAAEIAEISGKTVFCVDDSQVYTPSSLGLTKDLIRRIPANTPSIGMRIVKKIRRTLLPA